MVKFRLLLSAVLLVVLAMAAGACAGTPAASQDESRALAEEFVKQEATFRFDGIPETLGMTGSRSVFGGWEFTYEFDSRQAGYGDRTGLMLAQVITHHRAVVEVKNNKVDYAVMDGVWDMVAQRDIST